MKTIILIFRQKRRDKDMSSKFYFTMSNSRLKIYIIWDVQWGEAGEMELLSYFFEYAIRSKYVPLEHNLIFMCCRSKFNCVFKGEFA